MCDCIKKIENKVKNDIKKNKEFKNLEIESVICCGAAWIENDGKLVTGLTIPFEIHHRPVGRKKKTTINMTANYCPWCGKEIKI